MVIPKETIAKEYAHALADVAKSAQIKGFRPGKAPIKLVEAQTDKSKIYSHVLDHVLSPAYSEVIHEHKLVPLIDPHVDPKSMEEGKDWVMAVEVAVSPEIDLGDYESFVQKALKKHEKDHKKEAKPAKEGEKAVEPSAEEEKEHKLNVIFDALLDNAKIEVSQILIDEETRSSLNRLANQLSSLKLSLEDYAKSIKKTVADLVNEYKKTAESNLRLEFILQKLIDIKKPEVSDAEVQELKPQKGQESYAKYVIQKRKILDILAAL